MTREEVAIANSVVVTNDIMEEGTIFIYGSVKCRDGKYVYECFLNDNLVADHLINFLTDYVSAEVEK